MPFLSRPGPFDATVLKQRIEEQLPERRPPLTGESQAVPASAPIGEDAAVDLTALRNVVEADGFIRAVYRTVLAREPDASGFHHYRNMLVARGSRDSVLRAVMESEEAQRRGNHYFGLTPLAPLKAPWISRLRAGATLARHAVWGRLLRVARPFFRRSRLELMDSRIDRLATQVALNTERLSQKSDDSLRLISRKLDDYYGDTNARVNGIVAPLAEQTRELLALYDGLTREIRQMNSGLGRALTEGLRAIAEAERELRTEAIELQRVQIEALVGPVSGRLMEIERRLKAAEAYAENNVAVTEVNGFIVGVPGEEWRVAAHHTFRGTMEPGLFRLVERILAPGMFFVDVGAYVGIYTLLAARTVGPSGRVIAYEPTPRTFGILQGNVQVNGFLEAGNIRLRNVAALNRQGEADLALFRNNLGHNTLFLPEGHTETFRVGTVRLDDELGAQRRLDVIKIDAEGAEPLILRGMERTIAANPKLQIMLEFAPVHLRRAGLTGEEFLDLIGNMGFRIWRIDDASGELADVEREDLLFVRSANLYLRRR